MYDLVPDILNQIPLVHGPRDLLSRYLAFADERTRDLGVRLRVRRDFDRLIALNEQCSDSWPKLSPIFNPRYNDLSGGRAFWIEGIDRSGDTVLTNAARLYELGDRSLADELRSLRVFYDDPSPFVAAGEAVEVTAPSATRIVGRVTFAGALWIRPDYRRFGLATIMPRLTRSCALTAWNSPNFWTYVDRKLDEVGLTQAYGYSHSEDRIITHMRTWRGDYEVLLLSQDRDMLLAAVESALEKSGTGSARCRDMHIAKNSPPLERHGMSTRS